MQGPGFSNTLSVCIRRLFFFFFSSRVPLEEKLFLLS
ncbi:unnamed protein product [Staurois parvus]|uniref:Uncharacterized protein n=1 Tax=Staurois parvus TaxID=386267 RepID=A0ABN9BRF3_9NEOB|nr:unnamed protein product [Staurois parvus]